MVHNVSKSWRSKLSNSYNFHFYPLHWLHLRGKPWMVILVLSKRKVQWHQNIFKVINGHLLVNYSISIQCEMSFWRSFLFFIDTDWSPFILCGLVAASAEFGLPQCPLLLPDFRPYKNTQFSEVQQQIQRKTNTGPNSAHCSFQITDLTIIHNFLKYNNKYKWKQIQGPNSAHCSFQIPDLTGKHNILQYNNTYKGNQI